jgi:toxin HigB-1
MKIRSVAHRALRRFMEHDNASGLAPSIVEKVRNILTFIQEMEGPQELHDIPSWKAHKLIGARRGTWSLSVTHNWRITFKIAQNKKEIFDLNLEDYH